MGCVDYSSLCVVLLTSDKSGLKSRLKTKLMLLTSL